MKAWELLDSPAKWTQNFIARDNNGTPVESGSPLACRWCVMGAISRCYPIVEERLPAIRAVEEAIKEATEGGYDGAADWQDDPERHYSEVYELLRRLDI